MAFTIISTTDVHGNLLAYDFVNSITSKKGLSRFSSYLKSKRENEKVIYVDNGDINQGTPIVTYSNSNISHNVVAVCLNYLNCDYINIGNHDFNYGSEFLYTYVKENNAECITQNVKYKEKNLGNFKIIEIDGKKVAFIGVVTDYIHNWENPKNLENLEILNVFDVVKESVDKVRREVDYVVVFYHGGFERDLETGKPTENLTGENIGYKMCDEIDGIDVLITGHQHRNLVGKIKNTVVIQCQDGCSKCMEVNIDDEISANIIDVSEYDIDKELEKKFDLILKDTELWLDTEIGVCNLEDVYIKDIKQAQLEKHPISSFINKIQKEYMNADISACCLFDVMPGFGKNLKYRDIILNYPFPNTLVLKEMTGEDLLQYLTQLSDYWVVNDDKIEINPKFLYPKREIYNYDLLDGIEYTINVSKIGKNFITDVKINGENLILDKKYSLVLNNYRATGGGNFSLFPKLKTLKEDTRDIADVLIDYVKKHNYIEIENKKNIKLKIV
ncbi:MAG: bifunctional UDP-sugar hydrolase/5'-nucleotidase [Parvimonas sp.]|uniref:bifunctional metallophosphatase/5'-nucleotidase n=1 Tax=Parvimonas sp. TaxID=1944660 RepID=UPI0025D6D20A|nr:bifunctional UDP-sugar hydrolase/5'-nucleotidase [Parvimonas sp.]MCI5996944.1 bifunctional metallophosphatase/5'-nucleotidase [Parvimonas sp.]MDY3050286.1 bifunctional UDP-sugar hydrolase/5'-nucleotidase [Parvimonas sp.]